MILARYHGADVYIPPVLEEIELDSLPPIPTIELPIVPPAIDTLMDSINGRPDTTREPARDTSLRKLGPTRPAGV